MRTPFRATYPQRSRLGLPAFASGHVGPENAFVTDRVNALSPRASSGYWGRHSGSEQGRGFAMYSASIGSDMSASDEATTVVGRLLYQGRVFRVHFDEGAPPGCGATTVASQVLSIWEDPSCTP